MATRSHRRLTPWQYKIRDGRGRLKIEEAESLGAIVLRLTTEAAKKTSEAAQQNRPATG